MFSVCIYYHGSSIKKILGWLQKKIENMYGVGHNVIRIELMLLAVIVLVMLVIIQCV